MKDVRVGTVGGCMRWYVWKFRGGDGNGDGNVMDRLNGLCK